MGLLLSPGGKVCRWAPPVLLPSEVPLVSRKELPSCSNITAGPRRALLRASTCWNLWHRNWCCGRGASGRWRLRRWWGKTTRPSLIYCVLCFCIEPGPLGGSAGPTSDSWNHNRSKMSFGKISNSTYISNAPALWCHCDASRFPVIPLSSSSRKLKDLLPRRSSPSPSRSMLRHSRKGRPTVASLYRKMILFSPEFLFYVISLLSDMF